MIVTSLRFLLTAVLIVEAIGDGEGEHSIDKRSVSVLARLGQLPYQGKRLEKSSLDELAERLEEEQHAKRYLGALAKTGDLRSRDADEKRDEFESLVHDLASAEEARRGRLEALRGELDFFPEDPSEEKRSSMAALARAGALPKRVLDDEEMMVDDMSDDKRGISSIARNRYFQKRIGDDDLEQLMSEVYGIGEKRNVASLARGFSLPQGKREEMDDEKRNLPSIVRDRSEPLGEGKRHGAFVSNHGIPFVNDKRNVGALARNRELPYTMSKRDTNEDHNRYAPEPTKEDEHSRSKREAADKVDKRYFGVRGGGKMPGGRLPKVGSRSRNRHENSGRRRGGH